MGLRGGASMLSLLRQDSPKKLENVLKIQTSNKYLEKKTQKEIKTKHTKGGEFKPCFRGDGC